MVKRVLSCECIVYRFGFTLISILFRAEDRGRPLTSLMCLSACSTNLTTLGYALLYCNLFYACVRK